MSHVMKMRILAAKNTSVSSKGAQHQIQFLEDKPFHERAQWAPLTDLEDLHEQLAESKRTSIFQESHSPLPIMMV